MINLFEILGIIGVLIIIIGILLRDSKKEHISFILGGIFLVAYSYFLNSLIFIILQTVLIIASSYELLKFDLKK